VVVVVFYQSLGSQSNSGLASTSIHGVVAGLDGLYSLTLRRRGLCVRKGGVYLLLCFLSSVLYALATVCGPSGCPEWATFFVSAVPAIKYLDVKTHSLRPLMDDVICPESNRIY
jgi:hypothetical protein